MNERSNLSHSERAVQSSHHDALERKRLDVLRWSGKYIKQTKPKQKTKNKKTNVASSDV